jgi:ABC-type transport system substrate-binding protein
MPGFQEWLARARILAAMSVPRHRSMLILAPVLAVAVALAGSWHPSPVAAARDSVTILGASAASLDPAIQSDAGSAEVVSQLFETLTAVDSQQHVQPALAANWQTSNGGKTVVFHLRSGLKFSDGSPLTAGDVVKSWLRVINPRQPSQLASLMDGVAGAKAYRQGKGSASDVGLAAPNDTEVDVTLAIASSDFPSIVSGPTFAVVPPQIDSDPGVLDPGTFVGSGAYVLTGLTRTETTMKANPYYWAGTPPIGTIHLLSQLPNGDAVTAFQDGTLDYTPISVGDATWIAYDKTLGPSLRVEPSPSVEYYGFNTTKAPFDNVHVRRAFEMGIDWKRLVTLMGNPLVVPATSMVPAGIPGHSATDYGPKFDLAAARSELAAAGYANGAGFPKVTLITPGATLDAAIIAQLKTNLGIDLSYEALDWSTYNQMLLTDAPGFWWMDWVADYPGANDFLGILLGDGETNNFGRWSNADFETALSNALSATDATAMQQAFDTAQSIVADQAPVIPVDYGSGYTLAAPGLLGAVPNSQGLVRYAGLSWAGN